MDIVYILLYMFQSFKTKQVENTLYIYNATQDNINEIVWPQTIKHIHMQYCFADHIDVLHGVESFSCEKCLKSINLPDSMKRVYLSNNMLTELNVPNTIEVVIADNNYLETIVFTGGDPINLVEINLSHNRLQHLNFKPSCSLECVDLRFNNWTSLEHINEKLRDFIRTHEDCYI